MMFIQRPTPGFSARERKTMSAGISIKTAAVSNEP